MPARTTDQYETRRGKPGRVLLLAAGISALLATTANAVIRFFCWQGNGGYTMTGRFSYPDDLADRPIIREGDVTEFEIIGYFEGNRIGSWNLMWLNDDTSWLLRYDTRRGLFPLKGSTGLYQMWNANGLVNDCGVPGFGFNAGNGGQDVCIDNTFILSSSIDWDTPLVTLDQAPSPDCQGTLLMGRLGQDAIWGQG